MGKKKEEVNLKKLSMDQLEEMLTDVINAREAYPENSMSKRALALDEQYGKIDSEIGERKKFHDKFPWCNRDEDINGYGNSYITVYVLQSGIDQDEFEDIIYTCGLGSQIMYCENRKCTDSYEFDLHKGYYYQVCLLSQKMPEAVVLAVDDWDMHDIYICKNGKEYPNFSVEWEDKEPEAYREEYDEEDYYDCDVKVTVLLPNGEEYSILCGGGRCTEEEKTYYDNLIASSKPLEMETPNMVITIDQLRNEATRETLRNLTILGNTVIKIIDGSLPPCWYWLAEYQNGDEGITLKDEHGDCVLSWGYTDKGEFVIECGGGYWGKIVEPPKALRTICTEKATYFEQLLEFTDTHVFGPFGVTAVGKYATA